MVGKKLSHYRIESVLNEEWVGASVEENWDQVLRFLSDVFGSSSF